MFWNYIIIIIINNNNNNNNNNRRFANTFNQNTGLIMYEFKLKTRFFLWVKKKKVPKNTRGKFRKRHKYSYAFSFFFFRENLNL